MLMERLTAGDQLMLWPDEIWPQDIGALAVLDGSSLLDPGNRFRIEAIREAVAARLHLVPRFRQLLYVPPRRLGGPLWVDAAAFDLGEHIAELPLPAPCDDAQLLRPLSSCGGDAWTGHARCGRMPPILILSTTLRSFGFRGPATRPSCCSQLSSCGSDVWIGHARCGRCGSSPGCRTDGLGCS